MQLVIYKHFQHATKKNQTFSQNLVLIRETNLYLNQINKNVCHENKIKIEYLPYQNRLDIV